MHWGLAACLLLVIAHPVMAEICPPKYRFVDFGLEGRDQVLRRGGTILRAFDAQGTPLLLPDSTVCRAVDEVARDGRALPIPVVAHVAVNLQVAGLDLTSLELSVVKDAARLADTNAAAHRNTLALPDSITMRGPSFLCASAAGSVTISCQLVSPYPVNAPLVVYCDALQCKMPVLQRDAQLNISATWRQDTSDPAMLGNEISAKIQMIYSFWEGQI